MKILCLDSSTNLASLSLFDRDILLVEKKSTVLRTHSEFVNAALEQICKEVKLDLRDINLFAVGTGPGSFTGIRVALSLAKTFSYLLKVPVVTFNSLELLNVQATSKSDHVLTLLNAHKHQAYTALFQGSSCMMQPRSIPFTEIPSQLKIAKDAKLSLIGNCWELASSLILRDFPNAMKDSSAEELPESKSMIQLLENANWKPQTNDWNSLIPLYIRASEAEESLKK